MFDALLRRVGRLAHGQPPPPCVHGADDWPACVPEHNPLELPGNADARAAAAMSIVDDDCYGYMLVTFHKEAVTPRVEVRMQAQIDRGFWPALIVLLTRVIDAAPPR